MQTLFSGLPSFGAHPALISDDGTVTSYADLAALADGLAAPLPSTRQLIAIEIQNELDPIAFYLGALRAGHVAFLTGPIGDAFDGLAARFGINAVYRKGAAGWSLERLSDAPVALHPDLAVLLSTSGTTGSPKLIRLSRDNLQSNADAIAEYLEFAEGECAITALPPYYSYGMSVLHSHLLHGHSVILSQDTVVDPKFWRLADGHRATSFAGVPYTFELLAQSGFLQSEHPSLRYFTQAGGKLDPAIVARFADYGARHGMRCYVMYGQTEASPRMAYVPPEAIAAHPDVIGVPIPGGRFDLEPVEADGLPEGAGELIFQGPGVMMGYALERDDLALGQGSDRLSTGDIAVRTAQGFYKIVGRSSRFLKIFGLRIGLDDLETRLAAEDIRAFATGDDKGLVIATEAPGGAARIEALAAEWLKLPPAQMEVLQLETVPRLPSGKPDYVGIRALRSAKAAADKSLGLSAQLAKLVNFRGTIDTQTSFIGMGGDSLTYVQAALVIEEHLGFLPDDWEQLPLVQLDALEPRNEGRIARIDTSVFLRAMAVLIVVLDHAWLAPFLGGAGNVLMIIAGYNFSRFQVPKILVGDAVKAIGGTLLRIVPIYYLVVLGLGLTKHTFYWKQFLFVGNFTLHVTDADNPFLIYWFVEDFVIFLLGFGALLSVPAVRRFAARSPFVLAATLFVICWSVSLTSNLIRPGLLSAVATSWLFLFGWTLHASTNRTQRAVLLAIGLATVMFKASLWGPVTLHTLVGNSFLIVATLALASLAYLSVGRVLAKATTIVAAASFYIYIAQPIGLKLGRLDAVLPRALLSLALCVAIGLAVWQVSLIIERRIWPRFSDMMGRRGRAGAV